MAPDDEGGDKWKSPQAIDRSLARPVSRREMVREKPKPGEHVPNILVFCCNWCAWAGAHVAGTKDVRYPANAKLLRVICTGMVDQVYIVKALRAGIDGVLVVGCREGDCQYVEGNLRAKVQMQRIDDSLKHIGIPGRVKVALISGTDADEFANHIIDFEAQLRALGPNPLGIPRHERKVVEVDGEKYEVVEDEAQRVRPEMPDWITEALERGYAISAPETRDEKGLEGEWIANTGKPARTR